MEAMPLLASHYLNHCGNLGSQEWQFWLEEYQEAEANRMMSIRFQRLRKTNFAYKGRRLMLAVVVFPLKTCISYWTIKNATLLSEISGLGPATGTPLRRTDTCNDKISAA
jgi:hypothetical protein